MTELAQSSNDTESVTPPLYLALVILHLNGEKKEVFLPVNYVDMLFRNIGKPKLYTNGEVVLDYSYLRKAARNIQHTDIKTFPYFFFDSYHLLIKCLENGAFDLVGGNARLLDSHKDKLSSLLQIINKLKQIRCLTLTNIVVCTLIPNLMDLSDNPRLLSLACLKVLTSETLPVNIASLPRATLIKLIYPFRMSKEEAKKVLWFLKKLNIDITPENDQHDPLWTSGLIDDFLTSSHLQKICKYASSYTYSFCKNYQDLRGEIGPELMEQMSLTIEELSAPQFDANKLGNVISGIFEMTRYLKRSPISIQRLTTIDSIHKHHKKLVHSVLERLSQAIECADSSECEKIYDLLVNINFDVGLSDLDIMFTDNPFDFDETFFTFINSAKMLKQEGIDMEHCVGSSNYLYRALYGDAFFFHIEYPNELATMSVNVDGNTIGVIRVGGVENKQVSFSLLALVRKQFCPKYMSLDAFDSAFKHAHDYEECWQYEI